MQIVDADRLLWVQEQDYTVQMTSLSPLHVSPKNNLIIGRPNNHHREANHSDSDDDTAADDASSRRSRAALLEDLKVVLAASAGENVHAQAGEKLQTTI